MRKVIIIAIFCLIFLPIKAGAFSVSPLKYHVTLDAGAVNHIVSVKIKNEENQKSYYNLSVLGAKQLDDGRIIFGAENLIAESWVRAEKNIIELLPGEEQSVNFFINIPTTAKSGSHYLGLAVSMNKTGQAENVGVTGQVVSVLLLQVAGIVNESINLKSWKFNGNIFAGKYLSEVELENIGTVGAPVSGYFVVRNYFGKKVFQKEINLDGTLLPKSAVKSQDILKLPFGFYWPGPYNVELNVDYGLTHQNILMIKCVWFIHLYYVPVAIILLGLIINSIVRRKKSA